ncbi:MAG: hypothetical protein GYB30_11565 [Gammaproteobacteria bacterium]|jgi:tight adherence protein B|nr:hypothetical protein [Gammaproteobacteria bacterium]
MALSQQVILGLLLLACSLCITYLFVVAIRFWQPRLREWLKESTEQSLADFLIYMPASQFWTRFAIALAPLVVVLGVVVSLTSALLVAGAGLISTYFIKNALLARRLNQVNRQLPDGLDLLVTAVSAGLSFQAALEQTAPQLPWPLRQEWSLMVRLTKTGEGIYPALANFYQRINSEPVLQFLLTVHLGLQHGAQQVHVLQRLTQSLRQQHYAVERVKSLSAQARMQGKVMLMLPVGLFAVLHKLHPENTQTLLETSVGNLLIGACVGLMVCGHILIRKVLGMAYAD